MTEPIQEQLAAAPAVAPVTPAVTAAPVTDTAVPVAASTPEIAPVTTSDWTPVQDEIKISGVKYGEIDVDVVIPPDLANYAGEKGVDVQALSKELYSSPEFKLSEETLNSLYEKFPKFQVDAYLSGLKAQNDVMIRDHKQGIETKTANEKAAWDATLEVMGGQDRWADVEAYALNKMDDAELNEFNDVMKNGTLRMQQLLIKDVFNRFKAEGAPVAPIKPVVLDLVEGSTGGPGVTGDTALTSAQYLALFSSGKYKENPAKYDALRRSGMNKGI